MRPEGKSGALVRTLDSHISYYRRWAETWEFQALLKARAQTGYLPLGRRYEDAIRPMVWTASERDSFVEDVQAMRRRVLANVPKDMRNRELKLGTGGMRDVEFAVQLLQLVHGRSDERLRVLSTVRCSEKRRLYWARRFLATHRGLRIFAAAGTSLAITAFSSHAHDACR